MLRIKVTDRVEIKTKFAVLLKVPYFSDLNNTGEIIFGTRGQRGVVKRILDYGKDIFVIVEDAWGNYWGTVHRGRNEMRRCKRKKGD